MWRVDWVSKGSFIPQTEWFDDEDEAARFASSLRFSGLQNVVCWYDGAVVA